MVQIHFDGKEGQIQSNMDKYAAQVVEACRKACETAAHTIEQRGRGDIAGGGNFGPRWQQAFQSKVMSQKGGYKIETTMTGGPPISYWRVFEFGASMSAKNPSGMLWIPVDKGNTTWARDYGGRLFRAGNALFDSSTREPKYFGTPSVTVPKKWHLREIIRQVAKELGQFYSASMRE